MHWLGGLQAAIGSGPHIGAAQMALRAVIVFIYGLVMTRLGAWRAFGRWSSPDIIVAIVVGANLSRTLTGTVPLVATLIATTVFIGAWWVVSFAASRSDRLDRLFKGAALPLVTKGRVDDSALRGAVMSRRDLDEGLRARGVVQLRRVGSAYLERNGLISVILAEDSK